MSVLQCAEDPTIRDMIRQYGGLVPLVSILNDPEVNAEVLLAAVGAVWKLSLGPDNVAAFQKLGVTPILVRLLTDQPEKVRMLHAFDCCYYYDNSNVQRTKAYARTYKATELEVSMD